MGTVSLETSEIEARPAPLARHWPEYALEAVGLALFMISAGVFGTLLEYPGSPVRRMLSDAVVRRVIMGSLMGLTAIALIYSPIGKRSGAHFNPCVTLTFLRLGKISKRDAFFYIGAQFLGGVAGTGLVWIVLGNSFRQPPVAAVATYPGGSQGAAFVAEVIIAFGIMIACLTVGSAGRFARFTGLVAGALVALSIILTAPVSGTSLNPARTFGSAVVADLWTGWWVYFTAPPLGMILAGDVFRFVGRGKLAYCARISPHGAFSCIFCGRPGATTSGS
jgi:aquaporin Z